MINKLTNKEQKNIPELNTLKVLLRSLKYQLSKLNETNQKIENLKSELNGDNNQEKKREKVEI